MGIRSSHAQHHLCKDHLTNFSGRVTSDETSDELGNPESRGGALLA
jgi:hypothetical protein